MRFAINGVINGVIKTHNSVLKTYQPNNKNEFDTP